MRGRESCKIARLLPQIARDHNIDLIHSHLTRATYFGFLTGRFAHLPFVSSVHVMTRDFAYRRLFRKPGSHIITVSEYLRESLLHQGVPEARVRTIHNGTDFCSPARLRQDVLTVHSEWSVPQDAELIGLFARMEEFKGPFVLTQAVRQIVEARPRAYVFFVGPIEPNVQQELSEIADADGVVDRLRFTGQRNDVRRLMSAMDVVTLPSRYEACSMAILEAMALGKPVVATRGGRQSRTDCRRRNRPADRADAGRAGAGGYPPVVRFALPRANGSGGAYPRPNLVFRQRDGQPDRNPLPRPASGDAGFAVATTLFAVSCFTSIYSNALQRSS